MPPHERTEADQRAFHDLERVLEITRSLVAAQDLNVLLGRIITHSLDLLRVERGTVFLYEPETNELVSRVATGVEALRVPADRGIVGQTVQSGESIVVQDAYADPRFNPDVDRQTGFRTRNILSVPLVDHDGQLVGVLQLLNRRGGDFSRSDIMLAETLAAQAGVAIQRARLIEHYLQKQEMQRAMQIAQDIQKGLLPDHPPAVEGFDLAGMSEPADQTGGDTYDFIPLPDDHIAFCVADATGHGIGPALVIAETRAMLRASTHLQSTAAHDIPSILQTVNHLLTHDLDGGKFVTCFLGVLHPDEDMRLTYASAGHGPLIFYHRAEDAFEITNATGLPLGIMADTEYSQPLEYTFQDGDIFLVTTDGFFEAMNSDGECFGIERMTGLIRQHRDESCADIIHHLHSGVETFTGTTTQADDLTAIAMKRQP